MMLMIPHCMPLATADRRAADKELVTLLLQYPCGLVRGAMSALGHPASVKAEFWDEKTDKSILPTVSFTVKLLPKQQQQQQQQP
jgi:Transport protein particle (TRAPP) component